MKNKKTIIIITATIFILLGTAPWMNKQATHDRVFNEKARIDGTINKKTGELVCDYSVNWFPFGRFVSSCEGGYFVPFFYLRKAKPDNFKAINDPSDWKTYRNEKYGFEFRYPNTLSAENYSGTEKGNIIIGVALSTQGTDFQIPFLELEIIPQSGKSLIDDSVERLTDTETYKGIVNKEINIGGLTGREIGNAGSVDTEYSVYREIVIRLKEKESLFIKYVGLEKETLDAILSTFKFTK